MCIKQKETSQENTVQKSVRRKRDKWNSNRCITRERSFGERFCDVFGIFFRRPGVSFVRKFLCKHIFYYEFTHGPFVSLIVGLFGAKNIPTSRIVNVHRVIAQFD